MGRRGHDGGPRATRDLGIHCSILSGHSFSAASAELTDHAGGVKGPGMEPIHYHAIKCQGTAAVNARGKESLKLSRRN